MVMASSLRSHGIGLNKCRRSLREDSLRVNSAKERSHRLSAVLQVSAHLRRFRLI
jgi:hypothetical protein